MRSPWMRSLTLASANTNYNLFTLMQARDTGIQRHVQSCQIQFDISAGAANLYIGDASLLSATDLGVQLVASQAFSIPSLSSNLIVLDDIAVRSDTSGVRVNVVAIAR